MFTQQKTFNYQQPEMSYNRETGEVTIKDPTEGIKKKKIITSNDEIVRQKKQLYDELGLDDSGKPLD